MEVSKKEFAEALGVSKAMVSKYVRKGLPLTSTGKVDLVAGRAWVENNIDRLPPKGKRHNAGCQDGATETLNAARARKESALASLHELELRVRQGELGELREVEEVWGRMIVAAKNHLLLASHKIAPKVAAISNVRECAGIIDREIRSALSELSNYDPESGEVSKV